ncbi:protein FAM200C-like [Parasteatoda tepidariorum]|uniref:protein FAM200C-like n=1 Tax=Parasteatoda tepidariorum TaxID=114398 RepID=UPI0039BD8BE0
MKELPLSAKTIKDRTIKMCSNIITQHIEDLKLVSALSIVVDESCDINDTAHVSLFVRFMSHSGPKEELLGLLPLKGQTRGEDIANAVIECMDKHHIPLYKIVSISTDGAKSMTGVRKRDEICKVMELVITIINCILAEALNHRQFKEFLFEMESEYADRLLHNKDIFEIEMGCRWRRAELSTYGNTSHAFALGRRIPKEDFSFQF